MQNQPGSDLVLADCVRSVWPNGSDSEASRCAARIIRPLLEESSGPLLVNVSDPIRIGRESDLACLLPYEPGCMFYSITRSLWFLGSCCFVVVVYLFVCVVFIVVVVVVLTRKKVDLRTDYLKYTGVLKKVLKERKMKWNEPDKRRSEAGSGMKRVTD